MARKAGDECGLQRRSFLSQTGLLMTGIGVGAAGLNTVLQAGEDKNAEAPKWPWPYASLDVEKVRKRGHKYYYQGGCMYGASGGQIIEQRLSFGCTYGGRDTLIQNEAWFSQQKQL